MKIFNIITLSSHVLEYEHDNQTSKYAILANNKTNHHNKLIKMYNNKIDSIYSQVWLLYCGVHCFIVVRYLGI